MLTRILVPTDFSPPSEAALAYARALGATFGAPLHLLHVATERVLPPYAAGDAGEAGAAALRDLRTRLSPDDRRRGVVGHVVESPDPAAEIAQYAAANGSDLIVMGTHGRGGLAHLFMGSVAEKVVRTAPCPVLTVHRPPGGSGVRFRRILVPTDFSDASDGALACARLMADRFGASMHLLHVLEDLRIEGPLGAEVFVSETPDTRTARLRDARERLSHRLTAEDRRDRQATGEVIFGHCAGVIAEYAEDNEFDLIVLGTHGRTGLRHLIMGSVAERVVRNAPCPVLTTRIPCAETKGSEVDPVISAPEARTSRSGSAPGRG